MSGLLILIGFALFILGLVAIFKPMPKLRLKTKGAAAIAMVLGVGSCAVGGAMMPPLPEGAAIPEQADDTAQIAPAPAAASPAGLKIGDPIKVGRTEVVVTGVETRDRVGIEYAYEQASQGGVLVVVRHSMRNTSDRPISFASAKIQLMDPAGVVYSPDLGKTAAYSMESDMQSDMKVMSDLNPGITTSGGEVFEIAADRYDPSTWQVIVDGKRNKVAIQ